MKIEVKFDVGKETRRRAKESAGPVPRTRVIPNKKKNSISEIPYNCGYKWCEDCPGCDPSEE